MKLLDKLKNALFEEEYVEVEEKPKRKPIKKEVKKVQNKEMKKNLLRKRLSYQKEMKLK